MALRSIDPFAPQRSKKTSSSISTRRTRSMLSSSSSSSAAAAAAPNDENVNLLGKPNCLLSPPPRPSVPCKNPVLPAPSPAVAPLPDAEESAVAEIEYLLSENLPELTDPEDNLRTLLERLDSKDWLTVCEAVNNTRQLSIYHSSSLQPILGKVIPLIIKAMKNPRSALCKTAVMGSADLFKAYPTEIITMMEQLLLQLLLKASQDKKFVCEEAERALEVMTYSLCPSSLLVQLQPYVTHRSPRVRAKAAPCVYRCVARLGSCGIKEYGFLPLLQMAASQLNDQLPEARESARKLVREIYAVYPQSGVNDGEAVLKEENMKDCDSGDGGNGNEGKSDLNGNGGGSKLMEGSQEVQGWNEFCTTQLSSHVAQAIIRLTSGS